MSYGQTGEMDGASALFPDGFGDRRMVMTLGKNDPSGSVCLLTGCCNSSLVLIMGAPMPEGYAVHQFRSTPLRKPQLVSY
jgi:hypothetical protein